jgi:hypothetical protein
MPTIKIPRKRVLSINKDTAIIDIPENVITKKRKIDYGKILKAKGLLKNKKIGPIKYQRKIQREWD